jgi:hypothetical protein
MTVEIIYFNYKNMLSMPACCYYMASSDADTEYDLLACLHFIYLNIHQYIYDMYMLQLCATLVWVV